jgi:hypothetical protein
MINRITVYFYGRVFTLNPWKLGKDWTIISKTTERRAIIL